MDEDQSDRPDDLSSHLRKKRSAARCEVVEPGLFVTDAELIQRIGVPEKTAYAALHVLDREKHRGFQQKQNMGKSPILAGGETVDRSDQRRLIRKANRPRWRARALSTVGANAGRPVHASSPICVEMWISGSKTATREQGCGGFGPALIPPVQTSSPSTRPGGFSF
jgi:hypothetical protein